MTVAMPDPTLSRMADPLTRRRVAAMLAALFALGCVVVWLFAEPSGPYSQTELRHVSGLPYAPPQIQRRIAPSAGDPAEVERLADQLEDFMRGPTAQPTARATR